MAIYIPGVGGWWCQPLEYFQNGAGAARTFQNIHQLVSKLDS